MPDIGRPGAQNEVAASEGRASNHTPEDNKIASATLLLLSAIPTLRWYVRLPERPRHWTWATVDPETAAAIPTRGCA
jgi:hypothetical protein